MFRYFVLLILLPLVNVYGQEKVLLNDDFINNKNGWNLRLKSEEFKVDIKNGALHLEKRSKNFDNRGCLWYSKVVDGLNTSQDFSIILDAKFISGGDIFEVLDIQWGVMSKTDISKKSMLYQLNIFLDGSVRLDFFQSKWDNFNRVSIKKKLDEIAFDPKVNNKYEVIQREGFIYLNINNVEVFKQYIFPIEGNSIGFQHCMKTAWEIDNIIIIQHSENRNENKIEEKPVLNTKIENEGLEVFKEEELVIYPNPFVDKFNVKFNLNEQDQVDIYLINITGEVMKKETKVFPMGEVNFTMEAVVPNGVYIVRVISKNNKRLYKKILRVRS